MGRITWQRTPPVLRGVRISEHATRGNFKRCDKVAKTIDSHLVSDPWDRLPVPLRHTRRVFALTLVMGNDCGSLQSAYAYGARPSN